MQTKEEIYKQRFKELFFDQIGLIKLRITCDKNNYIKYFYNKNGKYLGDYDSKNNEFWLSYYQIWQKFESEFGLNYQEIRELTTGWLEEVYNLKGVATIVIVGSNGFK